MPTITARSRPRHSVYRPMRVDPPLRRSWGQRLAGSLRRRMSYAWSRWRAGHGRPPVEAAIEWLAEHGGANGIPAAVPTCNGRTDATGCPGITGGAIETALTFGARDLARRWAGWLVSIQRPDGSLPVSSVQYASLLAPSLPNTALAARGLLALEPELPDVCQAALSACRYLRSRIEPNGRISTPVEPGNTGAGFSGLACLPPLQEAARRFSQPDWEAAVRRALTYYRHTIDPVLPDAPIDAIAWWIETMIDLGHRPLAIHAMQPLGMLQRRDGSVPATPLAGWVSSAGMAHLAVCWYKLGDRIRADRAMRYLAQRQSDSGGFLGSWGQRPRELGACYHAEAEFAWTVKHYLDAAALQVQAAFDDRPSPSQTPPTISPSQTPPTWIDPADGRVQAVRNWFAGLPPEARLADVGCGKGRFLRHLASWSATARLTGIDVSAAMLADLPAGVIALRGSMLRIPAPDGAFDGALAVESLEHSLLPSQAVAELCRIVRPGGRVLIIDKHRRRQPLSVHEPWERWFTPKQLAGWLSRYCHRVEVKPTAHLEGQPGSHLFLAATGRRALTP